MNDIERVIRAAHTAARWHASQKKKGSAQTPYINHLLEVAQLVADATGANDPNLLVAALLHDAIEHQEVSRETVANSFGEEVAVLVEEMTDDKSLPEQERKEHQVHVAASKSTRAKLLHLADKTSNLRAMAAGPPPDWSVGQRASYLDWARRVIDKVRGASPWLEQQFDEAATAVERSLQVPDDRK